MIMQKNVSDIAHIIQVISNIVCYHSGIRVSKHFDRFVLQPYAILPFNYYAGLNLINAIKHDTDRDYKKFMASIILNFTTSGYK